MNADADLEAADSSDEPKPASSPNERALRFMFSKVDIIRHLELELISWNAEEARVRMPCTPRSDNGSGTPLGGVIATLIDVAGAAAVWAGHDFSLGRKHATISLSIDFIGSGRGEDLLATGRCLRRHRDLTFVSIEVRSITDRLIGTALMTFRIIK
jgi:uncharacterized protein (TIGR00369 family)